MLAISLAAVLFVCPAAVSHGAMPPPIVPNDNRQAAGVLRDGVLTLELTAQEGLWRPQGESHPPLRIDAFADGARQPSVPAPLIRVPQGTMIAATVRNDLTHALRIHGLCDR